MTEWAELVTWHRQVVAGTLAAHRAGVDHPGLARVRERLPAQRVRLTEMAARLGTVLTPDPFPDEIAAAASTLANATPESVAATARAMWAVLDTVDAALTQLGRVQPPVWPDRREGRSRVLLRNALIYAGFASFVLAIDLVLFIAVDEQNLPLFAPLCLLVLPAFAWAAGWFTVGLVPRSPGARVVSRTPRLGALICLAPNLLLCGGVGVLFLTHN